jgi:Cu/Ag efflux pump CusA
MVGGTISSTVLTSVVIQANYGLMGAWALERVELLTK